MKTITKLNSISVVLLLLCNCTQLKNIIDNNLSRIKRNFSSRIELRYTPKLKFKLDVEREKSFKLEKVLDKLK